MQSANEAPKKRKWTASQEYAISCRDRDLLLSAGAGSGKTATLTERVCRLVCDEENGIPISRMLIVTFTEAAAKELRDRVRKRLIEKLRECPSSKHLAKQVVDLDGAAISTISGFFLRSIKPYFSVLGLPPSFSVAEEAAIGVMKERIMNDVAEDFFDNGGDAFIALADELSSSKDEKSLNSVLLTISDKMSAKGFSPEKLNEWADALEEDASKDFFLSPHGKVIADNALAFADHYLVILKDLEQKLESEPDTLAAYRENLEAYKDLLSDIRREIGNNSYKNAAETVCAFTHPRLKPLRGEKKTPLACEYQKAKDEIKKDFNSHLRAKFAFTPESISAAQIKTASVCRELALVTSDFRSRFAAEKREKGIVDFEDIELFAKKIFCSEDGSPTAAAKDLSKRYDCIFIDEYQDTNRIQDAVFSALSEGMDRFMVGDVKQSIYAFRGAEPSLFSSYRETMETVEIGTTSPDVPGGRRTLFMSENFRSDSTVIDFSNLVSEYIFRHTETPFEEGDKLVFSREQSKGYTESKTEICLISRKAPISDAEDEASDDEDGKAEENGISDPDEIAETYAAEADFTAERIEKLLSEGKKGDASPVKPDDIAVLLRSASHASLFVNAMKARGIPVNDCATEEFFEQPEVLLVICLLNAIDNPLRDIYLAGAMKSPVFAFTVDDLLKIKLNMTDTPLWYCTEKYIAEGKDSRLAEKCTRFCNFIITFREKARTLDSAKLLTALYDSLSLYSLTDGGEPASSRSASIRENLTSLYDHARRFEKDSFGGLFGFIGFLNELMTEKNKSKKTQPAECVSVMTVHKSKGLEFPVCFLCQCSKKFNVKDISKEIMFDAELGIAMKLSDDSGLVKCDTPLRGAVADKMLSEMISEEMRILYVAMTRAIEKLVICISEDDPEGALAKAKEVYRYSSDYSASKIMKYSDVILPAAAGAAENGNDVPFVFVTAYRTGTSFSIKEDGVLHNEDTVSDELTDLFRERLRFVYGKEHLINIPAKLTVSKLTPSLLDEDEISNDIDPDRKRTPARRKEMPRLRNSQEHNADSAEIGTATHVFLQFCDFEKLKANGFVSELERLEKDGFITERMASLVDRERIDAFTSSDFFRSVLSSKNVRREFRFNVSLPAKDFTENRALAEKLAADNVSVIVQGVIDLVFEDSDGNLILADYKTDRMPASCKGSKNSFEKILRERHSSQLTYYKYACEKMFERKVDRVCVFSLALGDTVDII